RPGRVGRAADRPGDRHEVPRLLRPPSEQGRVGAAPVPPGVRLRRHRARPVRRLAGGPGDRARDPAPRRGRARRGAPRLRHLAQRRRPALALQRDRGRRAPASAAGPRLPHRAVARIRPLRQPPRPREADRPARGGGEARSRAPGRDRRRRPRPRPARAPRGGPRRAGAHRRPCRRRRARRPVRALPRRLLRAPRRGLRHGPLRGVPRRQAGRHDRRLRRPARGRRRPRDRPRRPARACRGRARLRLPRRAPRRGRVARRRRQARRGPRHLGRLRRRPARMKVAYYSPLPPSRSGIADYSALLLPALRERLEVVLAEPGKRAPDADVAVYQVGNDPDEHGWIVDALRERPGVVVLLEYVLHHLLAGITIGRGDGRGYLDAMERELGVTGRLLGLGVLDNLLPLLWETQPERFPLAGTVLDRATGLVVHSDFVAARARAAGYRGRLWRIPHPVWPVRTVEPAVGVAGDPLIGCFGFLNMNKRIPQLLEAFAGLRRERPSARLLLVGAAGERFDVGRRLERLGLVDGVER